MFELDPKIISFPDPSCYDPENDIIAIGGDLQPNRLWLAYKLGIFPWYNPGEEILWWCPNPRFVLFPNELRISKSMKKIMDRNQFSFSEDTCFREVMESCAAINRRDQNGTWISPELVDSFSVLQRAGKAKSIEIWQDQELVGGLYGVLVGDVFCGESMFSNVSNASKAGFIYFVQKYINRFSLIDCQVHTEHLESLGARMIPKKDYLEILYKNRDES